MDEPYSWNWKLGNCIFSCCPTNAMAQIIGTKPVHMVLKWFDMKLYPEPWVTWRKSSIYIFVKVDFCFAFKPHGFLKCRILNYKIWWAMFNPYWPPTQIFSFNSRPPWDTKGEQALEPQGGCYMPTFPTTLGWATKTIICGWNKFRWPR